MNLTNFKYRFKKKNGIGGIEYSVTILNQFIGKVYKDNVDSFWKILPRFSKSDKIFITRNNASNYLKQLYDLDTQKRSK